MRPWNLPPGAELGKIKLFSTKSSIKSLNCQSKWDDYDAVVNEHVSVRMCGKKPDDRPRHPGPRGQH